MPHSYGADFSGVGFLGTKRPDMTIETSANRAPRTIIVRMENQPCMASVQRERWLVNDFASAPSCYHVPSTTPATRLRSGQAARTPRSAQDRPFHSSAASQV